MSIPIASFDAESTWSIPDDNLQECSLTELEFPKVLEYIADMTYTAQGREIILSLRPQPNLPDVRAELERVNELIRLFNLGEQLPFAGFADVRQIIHKTRIYGVFLQPHEFLAVRDVLRSSRLTRSFFNARHELFPAMAKTCQSLYENRLLEKHITDAIDDAGNVKDTASFELARIRRDIIDTSNKLRSRLQKILKRVLEEDVAQEDFITQRDGRFVLPMKVEYKRHIPGIIHGVSQTGATVFLEPAETFDMNNELSLLQSEERREIERILTTLTCELAEESDELLQSVEILAMIDAAAAKARYAQEFDGVKPDITDENVVVLSDIRNPVLLQNIRRERSSNPSRSERHTKGVVPLSIEFSSVDSHAIWGHLISGPNAGGKTVAIKSIGLSVAMALSGIFPCGYCKTNFREIFSAIGDHQSIENDMSTFSSQMVRLREILEHASDTSLVLIDEICSGTDPQEGAALAVGILDGLLARKAFFVVTTHQSSLKSYALTREGMMNASMEFNTEKLQPTYRFLSGVPGNSYAFALARSIGLPPRVLQKAQEYLGDKHSTLEESIEVIQQYRREAERMRRETEEIKRRAEQRKAEYEHRFSEFKQKYHDLMRLAKQEAAEIVRNANKLVENTIREVREAAKHELALKKRALEQAYAARHSDSENVAKNRGVNAEAHDAGNTVLPSQGILVDKEQSLKTLSEIRQEFESQRRKIEQDAEEYTQNKPLSGKPIELEQGDTVTMEDFATPGVIIALDREAQSAVVEFDAVKFRTSLDKLKRASAQQRAQMRKRTEYTEVESAASVRFDARTEIDVRGMYSDEAIKHVEQAIADALTGNVHTLRIIHGKGTGALRHAIQRHLQHHPAVQSFRNGLLTEGGAGVTVVVLY
ncbi:MAG: Smr/MutS family protein [Bacteroidota bacterium]|nr:Smr/MutS family protein [Candidatus Kapabacteria bacterium]MDW8220625.1 Smr/MutS family protein [Bacteroidota bacterium]